MHRPGVRGWVIMLAVPLAVAQLLVSAGTPAVANEGSLPATPTPIWQTNGPVYKLAYAANNGSPVLWAAGDFTELHAPGTPYCDNSGIRCTGTGAKAPFATEYLAALRVSGDSPGSPLPYRYAFSGFGPGRVGPLALTVYTPATGDSVLYIGGNFTRITGPSGRTYSRDNVAAVDAATGQVLAWAPTVSSLVSAITVATRAGVGTLGDVYLAGRFGSVDGSPKTPDGHAIQDLAAVTGYTSTVSPGGTLLPWDASTVGTVYAMAVTADGTRVYIGGNLNTGAGVGGLDGNTHFYAIGEVNAITGALNTNWAGESAIDPPYYECTSGPAPPCNPGDSYCCWTQVKDILPDATDNTVYVSVEGTGQHIFDGTFAATIGSSSSDAADGRVQWMDGCLGATQAIEVIGNLLYKGSHAHDCATLNDTKNTAGLRYVNDPDDFPQVPHGGARHLLTEYLSATTDPEGILHPAGSLGPWYPNTNGAMGKTLGPFAMATDGSSLWVGGEFTTVNNEPQQGLTWFAPGPDTSKPGQPPVPTVTAGTGSTVKVSVVPPTDPDDPDLSVIVFRYQGTSGTGPATEVCSQQVHSLFWRRPTVICVDQNLSAGTYTWRAQATEQDAPHNTGPLSPASSPISVG